MRGSACSGTRTRRASLPRLPASSTAGSCAHCPANAGRAPRSSPRAWRCRPAASRPPTRWKAVASWRALPRAPAIAWWCAARCTPWDRRCAGFGYTSGAKRRGLCLRSKRAVRRVWISRISSPSSVLKVKERLTGAIILVALIVLLVPELLTGPIRTSTRAQGVAPPAEGPPFLPYPIKLGDEARARSAAPAASGPAQPAPLTASAAADPPGTAAAPAPAAAPGPGGGLPDARRAGGACCGHDAARAARAGSAASGRARRESRGQRAWHRLGGPARHLREPRERRAAGAQGARAGLHGERVAGQRRAAAVPGARRSGGGSPRGRAARTAPARERPQRRDRAALGAAVPVTGSSGNAGGALVQSAPRTTTALTTSFG